MPGIAIFILIFGYLIFGAIAGSIIAEHYGNYPSRQEIARNVIGAIFWPITLLGFLIWGIKIAIKD